MTFIFGGNTGTTYDDIQRQRAMAAALIARNSAAPRNVGEGLTAIGNAIAARRLADRADKADAANRAAFDKQWAALLGSSASAPTPAAAPVPAAPLTESQQIGADTMKALGFDNPAQPAGWDAVKGGIAQRESGGNYGALWGNAQNDPNSPFYGMDVTKMSLGDVIRFQNPNGPYAQSVKGDVGRVATPVGKYQIVGTTLKEAADALGLTGNEMFTPDLQEKIAAKVYEMNPNAWAASNPGGIDYGKTPGFGAGGNGLAGADMQSLLAIASNPYATPAQQAVVNALIQQRMSPQQAQSAGYRVLTEDEKKAFGLDPKLAYQVDGENKISQIGGSGVTVNTGSNNQYASPPPGYSRVPDPQSPTGTKLIPEPGGPSDAAPQTIADGELALNTVDQLLNDPYLRDTVGPRNSILPNVSAAAWRVQGLKDQLKGQAFLKAYDRLRGSGAITETESEGATRALARLNDAQSYDDYVSALKEFRAIIQKGIDRARQNSQAPATAPGSAPILTYNPATGEFE